jgi:arylsulfatase A-like enzyme
MMIRWPNRIHAGQVRDEMVLNIDVAETLLEIAGLPIPATMQGRSFLGLALGKSVSDWRKDWLYEYYEYPGFENVRPHRGIRTERYKLIHFFIEPQEFELYDLQTDSSEDKNLYDQPGYETLTAQLKARLEELRRETADQYQYKPSMIVHRELHLVPPEPQRPWRPNGS